MQKRTFAWAAVGALFVGGVVLAQSNLGRSASSGADAGAATYGGAPMGPAVAAPDDLIADLYAPTPDASWSKLQRGVGGALGILPASLPGLVLTVAELDPTLAEELDGASPLYGVVTGDPAKPAIAIAIKLRELRHARAALVDGESARYRGQPGAGVTLLVAKSGRPPRGPAVGLVEAGYLVIAGTAPEVERLAPYLARTLPTKALPQGAIAIDVNEHALKTMLAPRLQTMWEVARNALRDEDERMRKEKGGRAPDFGDPKAILGTVEGFLAKRIAVLADAKRVLVVADVGESDLDVRATLTPSTAFGAAASWVQGMKTGDGAALLSLPTSSLVALATRDDAAARADQAKGATDAIDRALGDRLADKKRLHDVIDDVTTARGDTVALAFSVDEPAGLLVRGPIRDEAAANRALRGALDLAKTAPFQAMLRVRDVTSTTEKPDGLGEVTVATVLREAKARPRTDAGAPPDDRIGVAWTFEQGAIALGVGPAATATLRAGVRADKTLADEPTIARFVGSLEGTASTILVGQPLRLDPKRGNATPAGVSSFGFAIGRRENDGYLRAELTNALVREIGRSQMGL